MFKRGRFMRVLELSCWFVTAAGLIALAVLTLL